MFAISFANEFYTLWSYEEYTYNENKYKTAFFIKNLSKNLEQAIVKHSVYNEQKETLLQRIKII